MYSWSILFLTSSLKLCTNSCSRQWYIAWSAVGKTTCTQNNAQLFSVCNFCVLNNHTDGVTSIVKMGHTTNARSDDNDVIFNMCCSFIVEINNILCYFSKFASNIKHKPLWYFCGSTYGWKLCLLITDMSIVSVPPGAKFYKECGVSQSINQSIRL